MIDSTAPCVDNQVILPVIEKASQKMLDFENNVKPRRRPTDFAALTIGLAPFGV